MEEQLISFETAKLAKEKGFNIDGSIAYSEDGKHSISTLSSFYKLEKFPIELCSQSLLQKWLREEHNIHVFCSLDKINKKGSYWVEIGVKNPPEFELDYLCVYETDLNQGVSYEDSLEQGLKEALTLISTP